MERVLVLNADYTPLNVISVKRGFNLVYNGKAEVVKTSENPIVSGYKTYIRPLIIRLYNYIRFNFKRIRVNRNRIYKRDDNECTYCGSNKNLTIDHIVPKSRGGTNDWTNLTTCCIKCNLKKADRTPEEAGMVLRKKPFEPSIVYEVMNSPVGKAWTELQTSYV